MCIYTSISFHRFLNLYDMEYQLLSMIKQIKTSNINAPFK
jgi:hypothetical protein